MLSKSSRVKLRRFHRWAGVIIGLQLLCWVISGTYFSWLSIDFVKGEDKVIKPRSIPLNLQEVVALSSLAIPPSFDAIEVRIAALPRGPIYEVSDGDKRRLVFDARTGLSLDPLPPSSLGPLLRPQEMELPIQSIRLLLKPVDEFKGKLPIYQVQLSDGRQTRLYVDPWTAKILARRNIYWRVYDFLWMLHILDFQTRDDFNNPFIRVLSLSALGLIASGYFLFYFGKNRRRQT